MLAFIIEQLACSTSQLAASTLRQCTLPQGACNLSMPYCSCILAETGPYSKAPRCKGLSTLFAARMLARIFAVRTLAASLICMVGCKDLLQACCKFAASLQEPRCFGEGKSSSASSALPSGNGDCRYIFLSLMLCINTAFSFCNHIFKPLSSSALFPLIIPVVMMFSSLSLLVTCPKNLA